MVNVISRCLGRMAAGIAGSAYYRHSHSNSIAKRIARRIYPTEAYHRTPHYNPIVQTIASRIYPIGRAFLDTASRMIKSWLPKIPVLSSFPYVTVEKIDNQEKIERIVYPFLFRVTGKDILPDQKVYLLGTFHTFKEADYPPEALALINGCDLLLSEFSVQRDLSKNPQEWGLQEQINTELHVHQKLMSADKEWIGTFISECETITGEKLSIDRLIGKLKRKSSEIKADQVCWLDRLSLADQTKIQTLMDPYGLQLRDHDPLFVSNFLQVINDVGPLCDFNIGEIVIHNNFQKRNCPIIELEDKLSYLSIFFDDTKEDILNYDLESTLKDIHVQLEPQVEEPDELQQKLRKFQEKAEHLVPHRQCDGIKCVEFKTSEALRSHLSLIEEAHKLDLLRSIVDDKIYCNFEEYEKKWLEEEETEWSDIYRNKIWSPKIPLALQQKKNSAVICGAFHLIGETGMVRSLRRDGYDVNHVKDL
jgi:hypothetical protein